MIKFNGVSQNKIRLCWKKGRQPISKNNLEAPKILYLEQMRSFSKLDTEHVHFL